MKIWKWYIVPLREVDRVVKVLKGLHEERNEYRDAYLWLKGIVDRTPDIIADTEWPRPSSDMTKPENIWNDKLEILR